MKFGQQADPRRKLIGLGGVALLHVVVIWALVNGLARKAIEVLPLPIETKIIEDTPKPDEEPPPPPPPELDIPPPAFVPPPEIVINRPPPKEPPKTIRTVTQEVPPPPPPRAAPQRVAPVVKARNCREPDYPSISQRLGEVGSVVVELLVGTDGRVSDSRIKQSSGYERLDQAALKGLSRCRFTPGTVDGEPESAWAQMKYTFRAAQ
jgi:protein TonB